MDRFTEMETFVRVAEEESFSGAARALRISPSAASRLVSQLEDRLGVRLINRTTRRLNLTDEGRAFWQRSARVLADLEEAEQAAAQARGVPSGTLRVNASVAFGTYQIAHILPEFMQRCPLVHVELTLTDRVQDHLEDGTDVAIRFGGGADSSLIARKLGEDRRVICAAPSYLEREGAPKRPDDLRRHNCLVRTAPMARLNVWPFRSPDGPFRMTVTGRVEVNNTEAMLRMALAGVGLVRLAELLVGPYIRDRRLMPVLTDWHLAEAEPIHAVYPHRRHLSARVRAFVDFLVEKFTPTPPWSVDHVAPPPPAA